MVRHQLKKLKTEIDHYLGIPYWTNKPNKQKTFLKTVFVGKGNWRQIKQATNQVALKENLCLLHMTPLQIYRLQRRHHLGIDCSGLAYHLADFWYKINTGQSIKSAVIGTDGKTGPKRVNVAMFAHPKNSTPIKNYTDIKIGDLIVLNKQNHILFVVDANSNIINYVHCSQKTKKRGVHYGTITITEPNKNLKYQLFSDQTNLKQAYSQIVYPNQGDNLYRLKLFQKL